MATAALGGPSWRGDLGPSLRGNDAGGEEAAYRGEVRQPNGSNPARRTRRRRSCIASAGAACNACPSPPRASIVGCDSYGLMGSCHCQGALWAGRLTLAGIPWGDPREVVEKCQSQLSDFSIHSATTPRLIKQRPAVGTDHKIPEHQHLAFRTGKSRHRPWLHFPAWCGIPAAC